MTPVLAAGLIGCMKNETGKPMGPPSGKTGNQKTIDDYAGVESKLATEGGPEFVAFCQDAGTCELSEDVLAKFKEILAKYAVADDEEYDYFAVVVRDGMIKNGLVPAGDPDRYQYQVGMLAVTLGSQAK